jgi:hypothetical protein
MSDEKAQVTIVSAFIRNMNNREDYKIDKYLQNGRLFLKATVNKVVFVDEETYSELKEYENEQTKLIITRREDIYLYQYTHLVTNLCIHTGRQDKDTVDYFYLMCNKTEWVKQAINMNLFNSDNFVWVDFGIRHIFKCEDEEFIKSIERLNKTSYDTMRVASVWRKFGRTYYNENPYSDVIWHFGGGVFGGNKDQLLQFADLTKEMCIRTITEKNSIMWEVNIWYLIYKENPNIFDFYDCEHDRTMIDGY